MKKKEALPTALSLQEKHFVFITGGVISSLGKGLAAASLGAVLKARGLAIRLRKLDPYLNVDPGTMSPYQHGEVFVMEDGTEADLDCGHYERFTNQITTHDDCITTGQIYQRVLQAERRGDYLGQTVQVIPHVTNCIKDFLHQGAPKTDVVIAEIGGTVGDIESLPFLEAIRQMRLQHPGRVCVVHVGWVPFVGTAGEHKTKPLQHSVRELQRAGIQPDVLLIRCDETLPADVLEKVGLFCNVPVQRVICGTTQKDIYSVPQAYHQEGLDRGVLDVLNLASGSKADLSLWRNYTQKKQTAKRTVTIGIVGKYGHLPDAYRSLYEALAHAGVACNVSVIMRWIDPEKECPQQDKQQNSPENKNIREIQGGNGSQNSDAMRTNEHDGTQIDGIQVEGARIDGILVPGGFGKRGIEGTLAWITHARKYNIPFFGICLGMQLAVIEALRTLADHEKAHSEEFDTTTPHPVVHQLKAWEKEGEQQDYAGDSRGYGGTMRLGGYPCVLEKGSLARTAYAQDNITERHRHRYEVNMAYQEKLAQAGLHITGLSPCGKLPEVVERRDHPFFLAVQFHPELISSPHMPHPLFKTFVKAALS